jgi:2-oxoglutarate ferredoxin oxidoreductase subunit alpha
MMEIPAVIVDVMRGGPASGMSTLPSQMDVMQARWGCHGDHPIIVLSPATVTECFELAVKAVNLSELIRTPVIILSDSIVGHIRERIEIPNSKDVVLIDRKVTTKNPDDYLPFEADEDGVPYFAPRGGAYRYHMCSNVHNEKGFPADTNHAVGEKLLSRLHQKLVNHSDDILTYKEYKAKECDDLIIAYGSVARSAYDAAILMNKNGGNVGVLQLQSLWPFPKEIVSECCAKAKHIVFAEMNMGQLISEARLASDKPIESLNRYDGKVITPAQIVEKIKAVK